MDFAALHIRSGYSFLQSGITLKNAFNAAIKKGYSAFGLTDTNSLTGYPELYHLSKNTSIKPIFGLDIEFENDVLSLFVQNEVGYRNLIKISYEASNTLLSSNFLKQHSEGLALILDISHSKLVELEDENEIKEYLTKYQQIFPTFDLGIPYGEFYKNLIAKIRNFVINYPYDLIAFPHLLYEKPEDEIVFEIANAIKNSTTLTNKKSSGTHYFLNIEEIENFYSKEEIEETIKFSKLCEFDFSQKRGKPIKAKISNNQTADEYLRKCAEDGLKRKLGETVPSQYFERLNYELSVISKMGYSDYFLVVQDYVNWARNSSIYVGPGRGSAGGSLVAYALDIVKANPLKYDLLFERFLNPERKSMPDIDMDFADYRRNELPVYLSNKYGKNRVCHIVTTTTLAAKGAIRDIGRVFAIADRDIDLLCKAVIDPNKTLRENYKLSSSLKQLVDSEPQYLEIVALASKIESLPRQSGIHAVGVILNEEPLIESIPLKEDSEVGLIAQYEHDHLEEQGFLKMDLLSLRNLSIIEECIRLIKKNKNIDVDYESIPYDDSKAIETIKSLNVMGIFQLESNGMQNANQKLNPTSFEDIVALISLYRPGPLDEIETYSKRKSGKEKITYLVPQIEPILKNTYGIIVYQEQIMMIAQIMAGFSYGEADLLRRAISKKDASKLDILKTKFINGCLSKGSNIDVANKVFELIYKFANYGFNKSHAISYGIIACQMAYLKTNFPDEFYTAILDYSTNVGESSFNKIIGEMKKSGYKLALPSINESELGFKIANKQIIIPIVSIKGINSDFATDLYLERKNKGAFTDFFDFVLRMKQYGLTQQTLVRLIDSGAIDCIDKRRTTLRKASFNAINYAEMLYGENGNEILLDFQMPKPEIVEVSENESENIQAEKEAIGMMISASPISKYRKLDLYKNLKTISEFNDKDLYHQFIALVGEYKVRTTKKGTSMAIITLFDEEVSIQCIAFQRTYDQIYSLLRKETAVLATVKKDNTKPDSYIIESLEKLKEVE